MRVEKELVVNAPVSKVYELWTDFEHFPRFMSHVESVTKRGENTYHWQARLGPRTVEWDAKVVGLVPDRSVTWRSTSGAENAGAVNLAAQGTITLMQVVIEYHPSWFEGVLDTITQEMSRSVEGDLERFKRLAEGVEGDPDAMGIGSSAGAGLSPAAGAQGASSASVGAGNAGASGPSALRAAPAGQAPDSGFAVAPADAAPLPRAEAPAPGMERDYSSAGTSRAANANLPSQTGTVSGDTTAGGPDIPPPAEATGWSAPAVTPAPGAEPAAASAAPGNTELPASGPDGASAPSLYVDEAGAMRGTGGTGGWGRAPGSTLDDLAPGNGGDSTTWSSSGETH